MKDELLQDLKELVQKHEGPKPLEKRICWVPVCEHYMTAGRVGVYDERGGETVSMGKLEPARVLYWLKIEINPQVLGCRVIETRIP